ncbi:hypothetical protein B0H14DRAFT_3709204 [Mycena olivaceomarginata]|nr:hypothetical protein B0H14DRAFT_3709204 [Mycena olivaceomarginata]
MASTLLQRSRQRRRLQENEMEPPSSPFPQGGYQWHANATGSRFESESLQRWSSIQRTWPSAMRTSTAQLKSFGDRALKRIKLTDESEADQTSSKERDALQLIHILELKDIFSKSTEERVENWTPSSNLAACVSAIELKTIRKFIWALLLLPNIQYYAGTVEDTVIVSCNATSNIKELPSPDSLECDKLTSFVAREFSLARYAIKKTITVSLDEAKNADTKNIAGLAVELLLHAKSVNATRGLYFRLAFIRAHVKENHSAGEFWSKVDEQLEELRRESPEDFVAALETAYEDDIVHGGDPDKTEFKTGNPVGDGSPKWLQNLSAVAPLIRRVPKKQGNKRKRRAEPEEEDEQEEEENGTQGQQEQPATEGAPVADESVRKLGLIVILLSVALVSIQFHPKNDSINTTKECIF